MLFSKASNKNKSLYYMVKKNIIQRNKNKNNINIKIHVGDKGKKKNKKKQSRKPAEKDETQVPLGATSSYSSYVQPYNPVYIQSGYPDNANNKNINALLELAIKGINNKPIEYYNNNPLTREYDEGIQKQESDDIPKTPGAFSSSTPYWDRIQTFKQEKDEMTPGYNDQYHQYLAEEMQKKKTEMQNNSRRYVLDDDVNTILANRGQVQRSAESDRAYQKRMKKNQKERERYKKNKEKKKNQIINDDEYNGGDEN
jgi:hypothetical protein